MHHRCSILVNVVVEAVEMVTAKASAQGAHPLTRATAVCRARPCSYIRVLDDHERALADRAVLHAANL